MELSQEAAAELADVMQALSSPARLRVMARLDDGPCTVTSLVEDLDMAQASVSNHLRTLRHLNLVTGERDGRNVTYSLYDEHVHTLLRQAIGHIRHE